MRPLPKLRIHRPSGQAFVQVAGHRKYLGKHGTPQAEAKYKAVIQQLIREREPYQEKEPDAVRFGDLTDAYQSYIEIAKPNILRYALTATANAYKFFGNVHVDTIGPRKLKALRHEWIKAGKSRETVNKYTGVIRQMFRWGVSEELVKPETWQAIQAVAPIKAGETTARERIKYREVTESEFEETMNHAPYAVQAACRILRYCGARPNELLQLRRKDVDTTDSPWRAEPAEHKTKHHGKTRVIFFGPKAQQILQPLLGRDGNAPLFSPTDSVNHHRVKQGWEPLVRSNRRDGEVYTPTSLRRAVKRAVAKANRARLEKDPEAPLMAMWTPYCQRHHVAQRIQESHDIDTARSVLGQHSVEITQRYVSFDEERAKKAMTELG